ncbi:MAG TPA: hypothetical protein VF627_15145 [Abditibacterium sp.]|jgi:hypothetical protein
MNDLWEWVWEAVHEDETRREWFFEWRRAMSLDESDPAGAVALLDATIARAERAGDSRWKLFLEHWKLQILLNKARDFGAALDCAARAAVEVRQPRFAAFPQRVCLHEDLISAYHGLDPQGYAPLIQNALDYMQREIAPDQECAACHRGLCAEFFRSIEHPQAVEAATEYLAHADAQNADFHRAQAYLQLCYTLAVVQGAQARQQLRELAEIGQDLVIEVDYSEGLHEILMWRALAARWNGETDAPRALRRAVESRARYGAAARPGYHFAGVMWHEADGNHEKALQMLDEELAEIENRSEFWREATRRLKKCELLREMGLPFDEEAAKVREVAGKLKNPAAVEEKLARLSGD